jgi:ferric-chelate reductase
MAYIETKHVFRIPEQRGVFFFVFFFVWLYRSLFITVGVFFVLCSYETLILVAGGIGVSPFVAILRDLLHRYQRDQPNLPSDVTLIWAVQKSEELQLLDLVSASTVCPDYNQKFNLHIHAFVTRETEPRTLEQNPETPDSNLQDHFQKSRILSSLTNVEASKRPLSILVGTGSNLWISAGLLASLLGYILASILVSRYVVEPHEKKGLEAPEFGSGVPLWVKGLFNFMNMILGVVLFGGAVIALWSFFGSKRSPAGDDDESQLLLDSDDDGTTLANENGDRLVHPSNTQFGHRPNLRGNSTFL